MQIPAVEESRDELCVAEECVIYCDNFWPLGYALISFFNII